MQQTFTSAYIRRLNKLCMSNKCDNECDGIGWCVDVYGMGDYESDKLHTDGARDRGDAAWLRGAD